MSESKVHRVKLTKRVVEGYSPDPSRRILVWDTEIIGFCVRIYPTGRKTYFFKYRNLYRENKFIKIGVHGNITTEHARDKARHLALRVSSGEDPSQEEVVSKFLPTMKDLSEKYLELHAAVNKRPKSVQEDKSMLKHILKEFGNYRVKDITLQDIQTLHARLKKTPIRANRIVALLHKMFELAIQWQWRESNPASHIKKYQENKRTRWLQDDEMRRLQKALDEYSDQKVANMIRLILLTGARKHEIMEARWDQFDLERAVWTLEAHTTKQKKFEQYPLSPPALVILKKMKAEKISSPFVFPGKDPEKPVTDIKRSWTTLKKMANIKDCTIHDLRHTYASHLVSSGLSLSVVGKLLGHTQASTTQRYAHLADEPLREATALFGKKFEKLHQQEKADMTSPTNA